jgi:hypothetical protein
MNAFIATMLCLAAAPFSTHWFNALDIKDKPRDVQPGTYQVWAWVPAKAEVQVTVNGQTLTIPANDNNANSRYKSAYHWAKAGEAACPDGKITIALGEGVVGVALSTAPDFDANKVSNNTRVLGAPEAVIDERGQHARHTDTIFTMPEFHSAADWEAYAATLRKQVALSSGLYPLPEKTPLNVEITGKVTHDDYTVEKVKFEAYPGYFVTGNLYKPIGAGPFPGMINPHGHWETGRLENSDLGSVPGRGITLARMGIVAFMYDMIGYNDSQQFPHHWGTENEKLWGIHAFGLQLWGSVRAVDFLQTLPEVMPDRIGCTGASGGGTQTFALTAIDSRIQASAPVNMISSRMQGGCNCENAPILRLSNSNMEIGALMAPRPLLMVSASGDWTRETPRVEYPALKSIYALYNAEDRIQNVHVTADHNYNKDSREAMYRFMGRWLLNETGWESYVEPAFTVEPKEALRLFPDETKATEANQEIINSLIHSIGVKWDKELKQAETDPAGFATAHRDALAQVLGAKVPQANDLACERTRMEEREGYVQENWILGRKGEGDRIPALFFRGTGTKPQDAVLLVSGAGKASFVDSTTGQPGALVAGLIAADKAVLCIDPFLTGEQLGVTTWTERVRIGTFMDTFQPTDTAYRVQDVVTAAAFLRARRDLSDTVSVAGLGEAGVWALFGSAVDGGLKTTYADLSGFDPTNDEAWVAQYYMPCIRSIGDVRTAAALIAPHALYVASAGSAAPAGMLGAVAVAPDAGDAALLGLLK